MSPSPLRVLTPILQIKNLEAIFSRLNPEIDPQVIDWDFTGQGVLNIRDTMAENVQNFEKKYPQYKWYESAQERIDTKEEAIEEYAEYLDYLLNLGVLPDAREDLKPVLEKALSDYRFRTERNLEITTLKRTVKNLEKQLIQTMKEGKPQTRIIETETTKIKRETTRPKIRLTKELERKLRDIFEATFTRAGKSPRRYMAEYRLEIPFIKTLTKEEDMIKTVEELAKDILRREIKPPRVRRPPPTRQPPPERGRIHIYRPPDEDEEEEGLPGFGPPTTPAFPMEPLSLRPFPRNLSGSERDDIWWAFMDELTMKGIAALPFRKQFNDWLGTFTFNSWPEVKEHFESLLEQIQTGKPLLFPIHKVMVPWKTIEDIVVHFAAIGIYDSLDEMITALYSYGFDTTDEEVTKIIIDQYRKGNHKLLRAPKEKLESLINQKIE